MLARLFGARALHLPPIILVTLLALTLTASGCGISSSIDEAIRVVDNGIAEISANSSAWQVVLQRVAGELPKEISETIRVDAQNLADRSIAATAVAVMCDFDFVGHRAIQSLQNLKAKLLGTNPPMLAPEFCQVAPQSVELSVEPARWRTVTLTGYDLDHRDTDNNLFAVSLLNEQGAAVALLPDARIGRNTHYQATLSLGLMGPQLFKDRIVKLVVSWGGVSEGYPQVLVIPWEPSKEKLTQRVLGSSPAYQPPPVGGDGDFDTGDGEPTEVTVIGEMRVEPEALWTRVYLHAREREPDHTEVQGYDAWRKAYSAPQGWRIVSANPVAACSSDFLVTTQGVIPVNCPGGEVVERFDVRVDRDGDESGSWTQVEVAWRRIDLVIEETTPEWLS
ncbi:MAG: hypothetical protein WCF12_06030 [Propionicimonas sp.]